MGAGESEIVNITTAQAPPDDVLPPDWSSEDRETISLRWKPPGEANGKINFLLPFIIFFDFPVYLRRNNYELRIDA